MGVDMADVVNLDALIKRQLAWDILPCAQAADLLPRLGLMPGSEGGNDLEHHRSHQRMNKIYPINDLVKVYSGLAGEVIATAILDHQDAGVDDTKVAHYRQTVTAGAQAVIANLIESGALRINEGLLHG